MLLKGPQGKHEYGPLLMYKVLPKNSAGFSAGYIYLGSNITVPVGTGKSALNCPTKSPIKFGKLNSNLPPSVVSRQPTSHKLAIIIVFE